MVIHEKTHHAIICVQSHSETDRSIWIENWNSVLKNELKRTVNTWEIILYGKWCKHYLRKLLAPYQKLRLLPSIVTKFILFINSIYKPPFSGDSVLNMIELTAYLTVLFIKKKTPLEIACMLLSNMFPASCAFDFSYPYVGLFISACWNSPCCVLQDGRISLWKSDMQLWQCQLNLFPYRVIQVKMLSKTEAV